MIRRTRPAALAELRLPSLALLGILALALAFAGFPALAQEESAAMTEAEEEAETTPEMAEEIIVTARRTEENVQEVPVAVSVVAGEALTDIAAGDISELQASVPNLSIYAGRNQSTTLTAFMRGIGQADPLWGVDPGVGLYLDDVYIARPQGALLDVFDVGRIEALRGPQGTLYGKNTIGGALKYVSKPATDTPEGYLSLTGGSYSTVEARALVSGPIARGKLHGKIAIASLQRDGYGKNLYTGRDVSDKDTLAYRAALDWVVSDDVLAQFTFDGTRDRAEPKGLTRLKANPFCPLFLGETCPPEDNVFDTRSGLEPLNSTDSNGYSMKWSWNINPNWTFKSITAYRESDTENNIDFDTTPAPITDVEATYYDEQFSQELQLTYDGGGKLTGVFGLYYFDGEAGGLVKNNFLNAIFGTTDGKTLTESIALFGQGSYRITPQLSFNLGLRATREDKNGIAFNAGYTDASFETITIVTADYDETTTFDSLAPLVGMDYRFTKDVMGYFSYSRGHKSGGYNVRAQATFFPESAEPFDDEVLDMVEVGVKSVLADRQLVLNAALFYGAYNDVQVSTFTSFDSDGDGEDDSFFGNFLNAGDATIQGVELEFAYNSFAVDWLGFSGNINYLDASPDSFLDENGDGFVDTQVITNAPELTGALNLNVDFPLFGGLLTGAVGYSYRDDSVLTNEGGPNPSNPTQPLLPITQESFSLLDAWVGWLSPDAKWRVGLVGKNLTDEEYLTNGYNIPVLGLLQGSYGQPRTVTATIEYRFF